MRPEKNPLDLNNLPDEYSRDGKQLLQDSSSSGSRKKKNGLKDAIDECGKVYECRFCSLKFCKSQALGGHMNRHRQERETETLNQARQLVYRNDHSLSTQPAPHLGCCQPIASGGYHPASSMGDPTINLRFPRYMSTSSSLHMPPQPPPHVPPHHQQPSQNFLYPSPPPSLSFLLPYSHDYYMGHVLRSDTNKQHNLNLNDHTCIGTPVGQALGKDRSLQNQEEALNWGRGYSGTPQQLDTHSAINRFQDGF